MAKPETQKKYNETITALLPSNKDPENMFVSVPLDAKALNAIQGLQRGSTLIFKRTTRLSKNGKQVCFLEIMNKSGDTFKAVATRNNDDY